MRSITWLATFVFLLVAAVIYMPDYLLQSPCGIHYIRQTDSVAFMEYFRLHPWSLFSPGTLDMHVAPRDGKAAGEFPLVYWIAASLDRLFGNGPAFLRSLQLLMVLLGHVAFVRAAFRILGSAWMALGAGLWLFGSSVVLYYACNYLPDATTYGCVLIGWSLALPTLFSGTPKVGTWSLALFTLAALIKAPAAMHLMAAIGLMIAIGGLGSRPNMSSSRLSGRWLIPLVGCILVLAWHLHARRYNASHETNYFLTGAAPIWKASAVERAGTIDMVVRYWWARYLHPTTWHVLGVLVAVVLFTFKRATPLPHLLFGLLLAGNCCYFLLFFQKFADHDYYFLTVMPFVGIAILLGLNGLSTVPWMRKAKGALVIGVWGMAVISIVLANTDLERRYAAAPDDYSRTGALLHDLRNRAVEMHLPKESRVIVLGDHTPNGALTNIRCQGWSYPGYPIPAVPDYDQLILQGATHVLVIAPYGIPPISKEPLITTPDYSLWRIIRSPAEGS